jgi:methylmalonyl-CoA mutase C-terminal domain/subunit
MLKVLIAKIGLDGHDRGAKVISKFLRDKGFEVVYSGIRHTPTSIVKIALQEDVDIIGVSILSGAHKTLIRQLMDELKNNNLDISVLVGGIIPVKDVHYLESIGVRKVFDTRTSLEKIESYLHEIH